MHALICVVIGRDGGRSVGQWSTSIDCLFVVYVRRRLVSSRLAQAMRTRTAPLDRRGPSMWPRVEGFSTIAVGIVAVSEPGVGLFGVGLLSPLRAATTGGSASGSVASEVCGNAARNGERPCASGIIRGSEG